MIMKFNDVRTKQTNKYREFIYIINTSVEMLIYKYNTTYVVKIADVDASYVAIGLLASIQMVNKNTWGMLDIIIRKNNKEIIRRVREP